MATKSVNIHSVGPFPYDDTLWHAIKTDGQGFFGAAPTQNEHVVRLMDMVSHPKRYAEAFTSVTSVTILGSTHGLATTDISVTLWDASNPRAVIEAGSITVHQTTFDVVITFIDAQSGRVVLIG